MIGGASEREARAFARGVRGDAPREILKFRPSAMAEGLLVLRAARSIYISVHHMDFLIRNNARIVRPWVIHAVQKPSLQISFSISEIKK